MHRTDAGMLGRIVSMFTLLACLTALVGCSGSQRVSGRVIPGSVGLAVVADPGDERLSERGVPGVEVALLRDSGPSTAGGVIAKGVSDAEGNFEITLGRGQHPGGAVVIRTRGEGVYLSRTRSYLPRGTQRLLCTVIEQKEPAGQ